MNFDPFNIGDYAGKTRHLSWDEDMAYRRLLDVYYSTEVPLPADRRQVYRLAGALTAKQKQAVDAILHEFFDGDERGFHNTRCDEEIAKASLKKEKAKQSAAMRWNNQSHSDGNANASATTMRTHSEGNAPNPNPNIDGEVVARARDPDLDLERQLREAAGWQSEPAPKLAVTGEIQALIDSGADMQLDVLPTVRAIAPDAGSRTTWRYFVKAIARARDQRIAASNLKTNDLTAAGRNHGSPRQTPARDTFAVLERSLADQRARATGETGDRTEISEGDHHEIPRIRQGSA